METIIIGDMVRSLNAIYEDLTCGMTFRHEQRPSEQRFCDPRVGLSFQDQRLNRSSNVGISAVQIIHSDKILLPIFCPGIGLHTCSSAISTT
jgi:hypothetical protein